MLQVSLLSCVIALISLFMRRSFWAALCNRSYPLPGSIPVGSTFNIQNFIPHKSQKTKAVPEANRAKEFQRGTAGVPESVKDGARGLAEGSDIGLGEHFQTFGSHTPNQTPPNRAKKRYKADETDVFLAPWFR